MSDQSARQRALMELRDHLKAFEATLRAEFLALRHRDIESIETIVNQKIDLARHIEPHGELIASLTQQPIALEANPGGAVAAEILKLLESCDQQNRINGGAIEACQAFTASLLDVLHNRESRTGVYTAQGHVGRSRVNDNFVSV